MKRLLNKGLVVIAVGALVTTLNLSSVSAQRPSRGSSGGGFSGSRSSGSMAPSRGASVSRQPSMQAPSGNRIARTPNYNNYRSGRSGYSYNRPGTSYRYGYRPNYYHYRPYYSYYNYYRPFLGFRINVLPFGYYPFYFGPDQFYYSGGLFYRQYENNYEVVAPPVGAEVPSLPSGAQKVTINGQDYYEYKGVYYTESTNADGKTVYVVAGKDGVLNTGDTESPNYQIGDVIDQLPEGCREVTIKNEKYYVSPDDVYYEEVIDGNKTGYRVIGKLF